MRITFRNQLALLKASLNGFDSISNTQKMAALNHLHALPLSLDKVLIDYLETLLYVIAYPCHKAQLALAEKELGRVARFIHLGDQKKLQVFNNSGMPFTKTKTRFSHDAIRWMLTHPDCTIALDTFQEGSLDLNDVLKITLPTLERSETTAGFSNLELMDSLKIPAKARLRFLIDELSRLDAQPYAKDLLFERLEPRVSVIPRNKKFSIAYNRLQIIEPYFHSELLKKIDSKALLDLKLPLPTSLTPSQKEEIIRVVKSAMALTSRETDPTTYMDESSIRFFTLERGISVAIYGMIPSRQLPLESYVGYTAFKNGFPVSYGGSWIFGEGANFGINIFKPYRSGESAFIMAQLLRVYRHVFHLNYFEVEPYQYGLDNPDGIASGAFWFYYRFGFRPLDKSLNALAHKEAEKIKTRKGYRTSVKVLTEFTGSNIGLSLNGKIPPKVPEITVSVTTMIERKFKSNRLLAESVCRQNFLGKTGMKVPADPDESQVLTEVALWAEAMQIRTPHQLELMVEMTRAKPKDVSLYQELLLKFYTP